MSSPLGLASYWKAAVFLGFPAGILCTPSRPRLQFALHPSESPRHVPSASSQASSRPWGQLLTQVPLQLYGPVTGSPWQHLGLSEFHARPQRAKRTAIDGMFVPLPKFVCWNPNSQSDDLRRLAFGSSLGQGPVLLIEYLLYAICNIISLKPYNNLWVRYYYPHCANKNIRAPRGYKRPKSIQEQSVQAGLQTQPCSLKLAFTHHPMCGDLRPLQEITDLQPHY